MADKVTLTFKNLTAKQAEYLSEWYSGHGESQAGLWFQVARALVKPPRFKSRKIDKDGNVTVYCKD